MNIFILDKNPKTCAEYHCDKHVVKMILESAQMLCTVLSQNNIEVPYKPTHAKHPCTIWASQSVANFNWLRDLSKFLNDEYKLRYDKKINHKSYDVIKSLPDYKHKCLDLTAFAMAMPDEYKCDNPVVAYRNYYKQDKKNIATWKNKTPEWWNQ
jgi:hypothetical protein